MALLGSGIASAIKDNRGNWKGELIPFICQCFSLANTQESFACTVCVNNVMIDGVYLLLGQQFVLAVSDLQFSRSLTRPPRIPCLSTTPNSLTPLGRTLTELSSFHSRLISRALLLLEDQVLLTFSLINFLTLFFFRRGRHH
jgi:hypothetical protein